MKNVDFIDDQKKLYDKKADSYSLHHGDKYSEVYKEKFIRQEYRTALNNVSLKNKIILDGMCAFGAQTNFFIEQGADVIGLDISPENAKIFEEKWNKKCVVASIHETGFPDSYFDLVYIGGGLHHVLPILDETIKEVNRILKPDGYFCFDEPNKDTWLDKIRKVWYKLDIRFGKTEEAISYLTDLKPYIGKLDFKEIFYKKIGNIAYLIIMQSNILGIPHFVKKIIYKPLLLAEKLFSKLSFIPKLYFLAVWQKQR